MDRTRRGKFVHVVASVDLDGGQGRILYVNPSSVTTAEPAPVAAGAGPDGPVFVLRVEDGPGEELLRVLPSVRLPSDAADEPAAGLIDEDVPLAEGMRRIVLMHGEKRLDVHEAGALTAPSAADLQVGAPLPGHAGTRPMGMGGPDEGEPGVSYTIQVRPEGVGAWQTIAVGRPTARFSMDRNQFPSAERATVRVIRTTGFEDTVVAEQDVDLRSPG